LTRAERRRQRADDAVLCRARGAAGGRPSRRQSCGASSRLAACGGDGWCAARASSRPPCTVESAWPLAPPASRVGVVGVGYGRDEVMRCRSTPQCRETARHRRSRVRDIPAHVPSLPLLKCARAGARLRMCVCARRDVVELAPRTTSHRMFFLRAYTTFSLRSSQHSYSSERAKTKKDENYINRLALNKVL
jgi:hypothetical protein